MRARHLAPATESWVRRQPTCRREATARGLPQGRRDGNQTAPAPSSAFAFLTLHSQTLTAEPHRPPDPGSASVEAEMMAPFAPMTCRKSSQWDENGRLNKWVQR